MFLEQEMKEFEKSKISKIQASNLGETGCIVRAKKKKYDLKTFFFWMGKIKFTFFIFSVKQFCVDSSERTVLGGKTSA